MTLELQAERIKEEQHNDIGSYFCARKQVRASIIAAIYFGVMNERITITC